MWRGLSHAWDLGYRHVSCYMHCLEAHEVTTSNIDVHIFWHREEIISIREMLSKDWHVSVVHIPQDQNMVADALAKLALSEDWIWKVWVLHPSTAASLLCLDVLV